MNKFKVGDRVVQVSGHYFSNDRRVVTVSKVHSGSIHFLETDTWLQPDQIKLHEEKPTYLNPPHKHMDLIIAWANGAEIQNKTGNDKWRTYVVSDNCTPMWHMAGVQFRIKPVDTRKDKLNAKLDELQSAMDAVKKEIGEL
mgnify:CR=1 FL=1|tara:strand:- start:1433 stop:1855 length:423 start_codon:yes stop_codon:yes gene_type:complete